jgi:glycosyltransferase involved in cell wall biosynthesis
MDKPLRIMMVVDGYYPSVGGAELQAGLLASELARDGNSVKIVSPLLDSAMPVTEVIDGIRVERIPYPRIRFLGAMLLGIKFALKLFRERHEYDAIHIHMVKNLATVAGMIRPFMDICVVGKISGAWEFNGGVLDSEKLRKPVYRVMNHFIKKADYFQCISKYTETMLVNSGYPPERILMIPNGVDLARFTAASALTESRGRRINAVYVGRVEKVKGLDILVSSWAQVCSAHDAHLYIAGDGPVRRELTEQASRLGLSDRISFLGTVRNVPELLSRADIYVQPSRQEGLPNSVLEAMAMSLPIVATRVSGNEDLVTDGVNGILVTPEDADGLAQAIQRLISNSALAQEMGRKSRKVIEDNYALNAVITRLKQAYRRQL